MCSGFLRREKIHRAQSDMNPRTLDLEANTLPRDHRGRYSIRKVYDRFFSEHLMGFIEARLHEATLNLHKDT